MSKTNDWGDMIIITLRSDGIRRHKKWCENYRDSDGFCCAKICKCTGSAFCEEYKSDVEEEAPPYIPWIEKMNGVIHEEAPQKKMKYEEYYRRANWGDKLLHRTVLFKKTPSIFKIGVVVEESFHTFTVESNGVRTSYDKKAAYRMGSIYIFTEAEVPNRRVVY